MARLTLEGRERVLYRNLAQGGEASIWRELSLELLGFALFPNPPEHVLESQGDEVIKLKDPGASLLISVGA